MLSTISLITPFSSLPELRKWLKRHDRRVGINREIPTDEFHSTVGDGGCLLDFLPRETTLLHGQSLRDDKGEPVYVDGKERFAHFHIAMCCPVGINKRKKFLSPLPVRTRIFIKET
jgi:hypothetical protein